MITLLKVRLYILFLDSFSRHAFHTAKTLWTFTDIGTHVVKPQVTAVTGDPTKLHHCRRLTALRIRDVGVDLVIIAITGQTKEAIDAYNGPQKNYYMAIDKPNTTPAAAKETYQEVAEVESGRGAPDVLPEGSHIETEQGEYEAKFGVYGWPHVVLLEPTEHVVIWEGFPGAKGFELTAEKIGNYIERGKQTSK